MAHVGPYGPSKVSCSTRALLRSAWIPRATRAHMGSRRHHGLHCPYRPSWDSRATWAHMVPYTPHGACGPSWVPLATCHIWVPVGIAGTYGPSCSSPLPSHSHKFLLTASFPPKPPSTLPPFACAPSGSMSIHVANGATWAHTHLARISISIDTIIDCKVTCGSLGKYIARCSLYAVACRVISHRLLLLRPIQNNNATSIHDKLAKGVPLAVLRRRAKRQLGECVVQSLDASAGLGDASAAAAVAAAASRARVGKRYNVLTTMLGLGASREPVANGRAVRVALQVASLEPSYFHADVCSHCGWYGDLARCAICHAALCSWHRFFAYRAGRDPLGRAQSADGCVCVWTGDCTVRSAELAAAIRRLDSA
jgi:hypothetical protein